MSDDELSSFDELRRDLAGMGERVSRVFGDVEDAPRTEIVEADVAEAGTRDLDAIQAESEAQALPSQEKQFRIAGRVRSKLHNLPDPTNPPLGYAPGKGFDAVFPFIKLPDLAPDLNGDWVQFGSPELEPNRLYYGDNLHVLRTLPSNSIDLIYIDPPFFSGANYNVIWGDDNEVRTFSDIWEGGLNTYLIWLNARLWEMRRVLKETGSIYVHCDWHASHYIKAEMDKIFGYENFRNEVVWHYRSWPTKARQFQRNHDVLLYYSKSTNPRRTFNVLFMERTESTQRRFGSAKIRSGYAADGKRIPSEMDAEDSDGVPLDDVWFIGRVPPIKQLYPTEKPRELLRQLISASSKPGDLVADFFAGGGVGLQVALEEGRRWLGCDSSRVAASVSLTRLVEIGEAQSGVKSNYGKAGQLQGRMDLPSPDSKVPDIRVHYVGVYPMDRFRAVDQETFDAFILKCLSAQQDASERAITGWRSAREPVLVGPADPESAPPARDVQAFFDACVKELQPNVRLLARVACWRVTPELQQYRRRLQDYVRKHIQPRGADLDLDFLLIDSEEFRERIRRAYPDADEHEFLLRFTKEPIVGEIVAKRTGSRAYEFEAVDADSTNTGGYLVNCQWDFDYQRGHFSADRNFVLCRTELKGKDAKAKGRKFEALLTAKYAFPGDGPRTVACRVQDNLGAETVKTLTLDVR
ncbi:MAG: site-specific DNA-methyltransferase [Dehalococcoidia bacterium]